MTGFPSLIAIDWGTTSLRAHLLDDTGQVLDSRTEPWGVMHVPNGDFGAAFDAVTAEWRRGHPDLSAISAGMIGSTKGWVVAPYCPAPAGASELSAALMRSPGGALSIVPGIATDGERPDVMRGEETQIVGALDLFPALSPRSLLVLPGTHSKWVEVRDDCIVDFTTYMTGELFAVLSEHSILGQLARTAQTPGDTAAKADAFALGVTTAKNSPQGMASTIFSARALVLTDHLAAGASLAYLSGLLIGDELRCGLSGGQRPDALVGDATLCARYSAALGIFGMGQVPVIDGAAERGLWSIARRAGLTGSSS